MAGVSEQLEVHVRVSMRTGLGGGGGGASGQRGRGRPGILVWVLRAEHAIGGSGEGRTHRDLNFVKVILVRYGGQIRAPTERMQVASEEAADGVTRPGPGGWHWTRS